MSQRWSVVGFTSDDVIVCFQDARLAEASIRAWRRAGRPAGFRILEAGGGGPHLTYWFLSPDAARVLDQEGVDWRRFLVGEEAAPPANAHDVLRCGEVP
jgi:hypothetical protein